MTLFGSLYKIAILNRIYHGTKIRSERHVGARAKYHGFDPRPKDNAEVSTPDGLTI
jgi:hypothetical protein